MGKITLLNELNAIGEKLGYPFYLFEDGSYGKSIVNGNMNAIAVIKKPFKQTELHEVTVSDKNADSHADCSAKTSAQSGEKGSLKKEPQTYEERVAELSDDVRKKLEKAILLVRGDGICSSEERKLLLRYAQQNDVQKWLQTNSTLSNCEWCRLFENSLLNTDFLKKCIEERSDEIFRGLFTQIKNVEGLEGYIAYLYVQSLRPSMLLWFMNKFRRTYGINLSEMEISFIQRCVELNDFSMMTEYLRTHRFYSCGALEYIVDEALNNPELYKWYTDVYLKIAQKSA